MSPHAPRALPARDRLDLDRNAYNMAFCELGLDWYWDEQTYRSLGGAAQASGPVRTYLMTRSPHLLRAYELDFLVAAIEAQRTRLVPSEIR